MATKTKKIPKNFVLKSKDLERIFGSRVAIKRKVEAGELQALGSGLYSCTSSPTTAWSAST
jgi:hypothetical protein